MAGEIVCRKRTGARKKIIVVLCIVALAAALIAVWLNAGMHKAMEALAVSRVKSVSARAMNQAILDCLGESTDGDSVIRVRETGERVYLLETDAYRMNTLAAKCAQAAQDLITAMGEQGISIPIGTINGHPFLAARTQVWSRSCPRAACRVRSIRSSPPASTRRCTVAPLGSVQIVMPGIYRP